MADALLPYYERELAFLRQMGAEYAAKYPKIAGRLQLEADKSEDPHVERLMQAFAFLAARVHHKLDDEFPEITEALLNVVYPHCLAPVPSTAIVEFALDSEKLTTGYRIERGTTLYSPPVNGQACQFRTCYPVTLWPFKVTAVQLDTTARLGLAARAAAVIRIELRAVGGVALADLKFDKLRFYLHGESRLAYGLYQVLFNEVREIQLRAHAASPTMRPVVLRPSVLRPVGFDDDESLLPYTHRSFVGYRLLQEYFALPEKFLFVDLGDLEGRVPATWKDRLDILILLERMPRFEQPVSIDTFRLGCTPIVNLFDQLAEPIRLNQTQTEYRVVPDVRRQQVTEVYSIDGVTSSGPDSQAITVFEPFYSPRRGGGDDGRGGVYWYATRRPSQRKLDPGTEVFISLTDPQFNPALPAVDTLSVRTTCTNRDLPAKLPFGGEGSDFELEGAALVSRVHCLTKPGETLRAPLKRAAQWRLISQLSLNYLSLTDGPQALREILELYNLSDSAVVEQQIAGLTNVSGRRVVAHPRSMPWNGFCRGVEVTLQFDEEKYVGSGVFLFASVLERFLGLYVSLNSFVQVVATTKQREEPLHRWAPRTGDQILL